MFSPSFFYYIKYFFVVCNLILFGFPFLNTCPSRLFVENLSRLCSLSIATYDPVQSVVARQKASMSHSILHWTEWSFPLLLFVCFIDLAVWFKQGKKQQQALHKLGKCEQQQKLTRRVRHIRSIHKRDSLPQLLHQKFVCVLILSIQTDPRKKKFPSKKILQERYTLNDSSRRKKEDHDLLAWRHAQRSARATWSGVATSMLLKLEHQQQRSSRRL